MLALATGSPGRCATTPLNPKREKRGDDGRPRREAPTSPRADSLVCDRAWRTERVRSRTRVNELRRVDPPQLVQDEVRKPRVKASRISPPLWKVRHSASRHTGKYSRDSQKWRHQLMISEISRRKPWREAGATYRAVILLPLRRNSRISAQSPSLPDEKVTEPIALP